MSHIQDILGILRALQKIMQTSLKIQEQNFTLAYENSSLRALLMDFMSSQESAIPGVKTETSILEYLNKFSTILYGAVEYQANVIFKNVTTNPTTQHTAKVENVPTDSNQAIKSVNVRNEVSPKSEDVSTEKTKALYERKPEVPVTNLMQKEKPNITINLSASDKAILYRLDMEHREKIKKAKANEKVASMSILQTPNIQAVSPNSSTPNMKTKPIATKPSAKKKPVLSSDSKVRVIPSSRLGRMWSFGSLAAGIGIGTASEYAKRTLGLEEASISSSIYLTSANLDRIVDTLCKVRGAALKLGQIMSIQDESVVAPELAKALERVRKSADYMPTWQVERVMIRELGKTWRNNFLEFDEKPFAAASIGQVHLAKLNDNREVAIKIQYPGVARGIESDIDNVCGILKLWNVLPRGMFLENLMSVAKRELAWEVDYKREADCTRRFKDLFLPYDEFYVPTVVDELSTQQVFTTEMLDGIPVDQCFDIDIQDREFIAQKIMELTLREIFEFRYMQTDPNWANFLYNPKTKKILLLDFGASRGFPKSFIDKYVSILKAACDEDKNTVLEMSKQIGFLTGYESKLMEETHTNAVMILGEVFRCPGKYDFGGQDMTKRINQLIPTMLNHRLCPPPEEIYSLHRKLSGVFLLCSKLKVKMCCRDVFLKLYNKYMEANH